ncbi:hypothetical protein P4O66_001540 [Electrophorus voltai]|uniref:Integrase catalytic domain-containing protein n=1 Tax=Electrophorus voltai TaxID=2609070 RepID=A0AAD8Z749_9TELE|nr:hypothetical protein P4O66_001540 [Electrophorus voltai]
MVRFIPLKTLPTTLEMADLLFHQVFHQSGLPEDIVSDQGPQFTSRVWKELLEASGPGRDLQTVFPQGLYNGRPWAAMNMHHCPKSKAVLRAFIKPILVTEVA